MSGQADEEWRNTKSQRAALKAKYDGRCAYRGCELDKMQAVRGLPNFKLI